MTFTFVQNTLTIQLDSIGTLSLALCMLLCGYSLRKKSHLLQRFCLPDVVIGGFIFMLIRMIFYTSRIIEFEMDTTFQSPAMIAFFTCIGLMTNLHSDNTVSKLLLKYWSICALLAVIQNVIGLGTAIALQISPVYGVLAGTTTMMGGHGNGSAFGLTVSELGFANGQEIGIACATFGMLCGATIGSPFAKSLIYRYHLSPSENKVIHALSSEGKSPTGDQNSRSKAIHLMKNLTVIALIMVIGSWLALLVSGFLNNIVLPEYIGGMFLGLVVRNTIFSKYKQVIDHSVISDVSNIFLSVFLSISMVSVELWQLIDIAAALFVILVVQVIFILLYTRFFVFRFLGHDYDSAVMCAGLIGHGLGATPNAIANMDSVCEKYGDSNAAMFVVPTVAASLIDLVMIPTIIMFFNFAVAIS